MKLTFLGDSITVGKGVEASGNRYSTLVSRYFSAEEINLGVSGSRIAKQRNKVKFYDDKPFMTRAVQIPTDTNFTFVFGGTNDYGHGDAKFGKIGDKGEDTFCGAFEELTAYLIGKLPKEKICFIMPIPRFDQDNPYGEGNKECFSGPLSAYIDAEKTILEKYGVDWLDLSTDFPVPQIAGETEFTIDGLHPNEKGHRIIADKLIEYLQKKLQ